VCVGRFHGAVPEEFHLLTIFHTCTINIFPGVWNNKNVTTNKIMGFWTVIWCSLVDRYRVLEELVGCIYGLMNFTGKDDMDVEKGEPRVRM